MALSSRPSFRLIALLLFSIAILGVELLPNAPASAAYQAPRFWYTPPLPTNYAPSRVSGVAYGTTSNNVILASEGNAGGAMLRSTNLGLTWSQLPGWQPSDTRFKYRVALWPTMTSSFLAYGGTSIYSTSNNGDNWSSMNFPTFCNQIITVQAHPTQSDTLYIGTTNGFVRTLDRGWSWQWDSGNPLCAGGPHAHTIAASSNVVYVGQFYNYGGGVYRSDDRGDTWQEVSTGLPHVSEDGPVVSIVKVTVNVANPAIVYALTEDGKIYRTTDSGAQWSLFDEGVEGIKIETLERTADTFYSASADAVYMLDDANGTWQKLDLPAIPQASSFSDLNGLAVHPQYEGRYIAYNDNGLAVSTERPELISITPAFASVGSGQQTITVNGNWFTTASKILLNGQAWPTTYVNSQQLTTELSAADIQTGGVYTVTVGYQLPDGQLQGVSNQKTFTVSEPCIVNNTVVMPCAASITSDSASTLAYSTANNTGAIITVAPGSVTETTTLAYTPAVSPSHPSNFAFGGVAFRLDALRNEAILPNFTFQKPISITLRYDDADIGGIDEQKLTVYYWDGVAWKDAATTCAPASAYERNPAENKLTVSICHLTEFALFDQGQTKLFIPLTQR